MVEFGEDVSGEEIAFGGVGVAGENEGFDAQGSVGVQLREHLVRVADDGGAAAGAGAADAGPEIFFGEAFVIGGFSDFGLAADADARVVERAFADGIADIRVSDGNDAVLFKRHIHFTDAPEGLWRFYLTDNVLLLPSEY